MWEEERKSEYKLFIRSTRNEGWLWGNAVCGIPLLSTWDTNEGLLNKYNILKQSFEQLSIT